MGYCIPHLILPVPGTRLSLKFVRYDRKRQGRHQNQRSRRDQSKEYGVHSSLGVSSKTSTVFGTHPDSLTKLKGFSDSTKMSLSSHFGDETNFRFLQLDDDEIDRDEVNAAPGDTLRNTIRVYGGIFLVVFLIFCKLRRIYKKAYNVRSWAEDLQCDLAQNQFGFFSWMWHLYAVSEEDILEQCGMDALCFIRILEFGFKFSFMGK